MVFTQTPSFLKIAVLIQEWLADFFSDIPTIRSGKLPKLFKTTKVLAALIPDKPNDDAKSYRPILLLSASYKLPER